MAVSAVAGLTAAAGGAIAAGSMAAFATTFAVTAGLSALSQRLLKPSTPSFKDSGRSTFVRQPISEHTVVYGETRTSGPLIYVESTDNDRYLHLVIALAGHFCQIGTILVNDIELTLDSNGNCTAPSQYAGLVRVNKHNGSENQLADSDLVAESNGKWTDEHRLRGIAYIYVRLEFSQDAFPSGIPAISAIVKGRHVADPRPDVVGGFTQNPALILRDYLVNNEFGLSASTDEIDDDSFILAANICDEQVDVLSGGTESRYTANGVVSSSDTPMNIIKAILSSCGGILYYSGGRWSLKVAHYTDPVMTINQDDLRSSVEIQTRHSRRDNFNGVKGIFISPIASWQPTDFPPVISSTFKEIDGGEEVLADIELPFTTSPSTAQRISKIELFRNRQQLRLFLRCNLKPITLNTGDVVNIQHPRFWNGSKEFEVIGWTFNTDPMNLGVDLELRETSESVYEWNVEEIEFEQDNTTLPDPFAAASVGMQVSDDLRSFNQSVTTFLIVDVQSESRFVVEFEVQARKQGETDWINLGRASGTRFELANVEDGANYEVRARSITSIGIKSPYILQTHNVLGKFEPPSDVENFKVNIIGTQAHLSWDASPDLDLSHYRIRHSNSTVGATYSGATDIARKVPRPATSVIVPAKKGTYFIKAIDKTGLTSVNAASSVALVGKIGSIPPLLSADYHSGFGGTYENIEKVSGALRLTEGSTSGIYTPNQEFGLSVLSQISARVEMDVQRFDRTNLFDGFGGLFDSYQGLFDGDDDNQDDIDVQTQIRTTEDSIFDSPTWGEWREFVAGEFIARGVQFRFVLTSDNDSVSPQINEISSFIDMEERTEGDQNISSGTSTKSITFDTGFHSVPSVAISASNLVSGDYYEITNKTRSGFDIVFKDSSNTIVDRTFDYVARGRGEFFQ